MVDFVIPITYNVFPYLEETIHSVLAQIKVPDIRMGQVIVIYNNKLEKDLKGIKEKYDQLRFISTDKEDIPEILNESKEYAKSDYISFVSQYSFLYPEKTIVQISNMKEHGAEVSFADYHLMKWAFSRPSQYLSIKNFSKDEGYSDSKSYALLIDKKYLDFYFMEKMFNFQDLNYFNYSGIIIKKSLLDSYGFKNLDLLYSYEFIMNISMNNLLSYFYKPLFVYNTGPFILSNNKKMFNQDMINNSIQSDIMEIYD